MHAFNTIVLFFLSFAATIDALKCYTMTPWGKEVLFDGSDLMADACLAYTFKCTEPDTGCSPQEIKEGVLKRARTFASRDLCEDMKQQPATYMHVYCCYTDGCNKDK